MTTEKLQEKTTKTVPPPRLRFKQFEGQGEWEEKRLGEVFTFLGNNSLSREHLNYNSGEVKNIHYGDIHTRFASHLDVAKEEIPFITHQEDVARIKPGNFLQIGDVVIADASEDMADIGKSIEVVSLDNQKLVAGLHTILARPKTHTFSLGFPGHLLKSGGVRRQIQKESQGAKVLGLSASRLADVSLTLPPLPEQQHIAATLSSLDDLITAHTDKLEALRQHKRGLMQGLFPVEGERVPRLRLPEFAGAGEWEEKKLGEVATYKNGVAYEQDVNETGKYHLVNSRFISNDGEAKKFTDKDYLIAKKGDTLLVLSDLPKGRALAKCFYVDEDDKYAVNQRICILSPKYIDSRYMYYVMNRNPKLLAYDDGMNQTHLKKGYVTDLELTLPAFPEQQRIADCLSTLDDLITAQADKIAALQEFKRGLMQGLFPSTTSATQGATE